MTGERAACVVGDPVEHSLSPVIHGYWLATHGIAGRYDRRHVPPERFPDFFRTLRDEGYVGANVTVPHKEMAARLVDRLDRSAEGIGAVNTVWFEDNLLVGANSDAYGFVAHLDQAVPNWRDSVRTILIVGAGGAARAVLHGLSLVPDTVISIANRTRERADRLASESKGTAKGFALSDIEALIAEADLIVNTTTVGMTGGATVEWPVARAPETAIVYDIVYAPNVTPLLRTANARGLRTVGGLGMLLHQAVLGFEKWFGVTPKVDEGLRRNVMARLVAGD